MSELVPNLARNVPDAMRRGARGKCPSCGEGPLFDGFLHVADSCPACAQEYHHHRADDAPAYLTILIVGHLLLPVVLAVEEMFSPALWVHLVLWGPTLFAACVGLLRPIKGAIVGLQWATRMHGFGTARAGADA